MSKSEAPFFLPAFLPFSFLPSFLFYFLPFLLPSFSTSFLSFFLPFVLSFFLSFFSFFRSLFVFGGRLLEARSGLPLTDPTAWFVLGLKKRRSERVFSKRMDFSHYRNRTPKKTGATDSCWCPSKPIQKGDRFRARSLSLSLSLSFLRGYLAPRASKGNQKETAHVGFPPQTIPLEEKNTNPCWALASSRMSSTPPLPSKSATTSELSSYLPPPPTTKHLKEENHTAESIAAKKRENDRKQTRKDEMHQPELHPSLKFRRYLGVYMHPTDQYTTHPGVRANAWRAPCFGAMAKLMKSPWLILSVGPYNTGTEKVAAEPWFV